MSKTTIEELKGLPCPPSPRKISKSLHCSVLTKSPLRDTRNGTMFSLNLCEEDPSSTLRAVCFNGDLFSKFEANGTYDFSQFKLKKSFGSSNDVELLIDDSTKAEKAKIQLEIRHFSFTISQILRGEAERGRFFKVKAKVISIEDLVTVGHYPDQKKKREILLADSTGQINMILWHERSEDIQFEEGNVLSLENVVSSRFNNRVSITTTFESIITMIDEEMTTCPTPKAARKSNVVSMVSSVLALKQYSFSFKCLNCRMGVDARESVGKTLKCSICSAVFLRSAAELSNRCMVLLDNKQWFTANTAVIQHLFQWDTAKVEPSEEDMIILLNKEYSLRVDLEKKVIEHVVVASINTREDLPDEDGNRKHVDMDETVCKKVKSQ